MEKQDNLNLKEVILGRMTRLRYVVRFSICPRTHDESVAEHSYFTAQIGASIALDLASRGVKVDPGLVALRAIYHDADEAHSGDFIRMFKHSSPSLKLAIDQAADRFMRMYSQESGSSHTLELWAGAKDSSTEGAVVGFADFLSVLQYIVLEIQAGNHSMFEHLEELKRFFGSFRSERYVVIHRYLPECAEILNNIEDRRVKIK